MKPTIERTVGHSATFKNERLYITRREIADVFKMTPQGVRAIELYFELKIVKRPGGGVAYRAKTFDQFIRIDHLIRIEGYSYRGAKRNLTLNKLL